MATIADVAKLAEVSTATVYRVINANTEVDAVLTGRVGAAIGQLDYRPSRVACSLHTRRSSVLVVIISDIRNPFFTGAGIGGRAGLFPITRNRNVYRRCDTRSHVLSGYVDRRASRW